MSVTSFSHTLRTRVREQFAIARERREHDVAMDDPRIRDEHFAARGRAVAEGDGDCPFCA